MAKNSDKIKDACGNYDVNEGYKYISGGNATEAFNLITNQINKIKHGNYKLSKRKSYRVESHYKAFDWDEYEKCKNKRPFREEEWICKHCMGREFASVGKMIDYQVPLKHKKNVTGLGKIDLLSQKGAEGFLLEVKVPNSTEEPLRAIMEIYTYWQQLGGEDCQNFLENSMLNDVTTLRKAIILYKESPIYKKLSTSHNNLYALMKDLGVECFIAQRMNENDSLIGDIV